MYAGIANNVSLSCTTGVMLTTYLSLVVRLRWLLTLLLRCILILRLCSLREFGIEVVVRDYMCSRVSLFGLGRNFDHGSRSPRRIG